MLRNTLNPQTVRVNRGASHSVIPTRRLFTRSPCEWAGLSPSDWWLARCRLQAFCYTRFHLDLVRLSR